MTHGRRRVVELVEQAYYTKNQHILDPEYKRKMKCQSWWLSTCFILLLFTITVLFVILLIEKFVEF